MGRILYTLLFLLYTSILSAQNIAVQSFVLDETDVTANLKGTTVLDQNGEKCALIKIYTTATGFTFDVGSLVVQKVEQKTGEIWVYVPHGVKRISMNHAQLGHCDYTFPMPIQRARTYKMELVAGQVQTIIKKAKTSQYVLFNVTPKDAIVQLDEQLLKTVGGTATKMMPFGTYTYRVQAPDYETEIGKITVNDPKNKHVVTVSLQPAFATVSLKGIDGGVIYVNDEQKGTGSWTGVLGYGTYQVECRKSGYRSSQQEITVNKGDNNRTYTLISPTPIYGTLDINSAPANAKVTIDGNYVGETPLYLDQILEGEHQVVISLSGYTNETRNVSVVENQTASIDVEFKKYVIQELTYQEFKKKFQELQNDNKKLTEFIELQKKAALDGNPIAQKHMGYMYFEGYGVSKDYSEAVKWYRKAAEQGNADAQNNLGNKYYYGEGVSKDYSEAVKWYRKAAEQGNAGAQNNLGNKYYYGEGVSKDFFEAVKWFRKSAEQGNDRAQNNLGYMYAHGEGVSKDYSEAVKWYRKAAEQGNADAQNNLGYMYYNGYGVSKDYSEAVKWFRKSAEQGNDRAQNNLGYMYAHGEGVSKDYSEAVKWYRKAAEQGNADAQNNLGHMYHGGYGVPKDYSEAVKWFRKSAEQGNAVAKESLEILEKQGYK